MTSIISSKLNIQKGSRIIRVTWALLRSCGILVMAAWTGTLAPVLIMPLRRRTPLDLPTPVELTIAKWGQDQVDIGWNGGVLRKLADFNAAGPQGTVDDLQILACKGTNLIPDSWMGSHSAAEGGSPIDSADDFSREIDMGDSLIAMVARVEDRLSCSFNLGDDPDDHTTIRFHGDEGADRWATAPLGAGSR